MEGIYQTEKQRLSTLFGWVDTKNETVKGVRIPGLLSYLIYHDTETPVTGFDQIPP